MIKRSFLLSFLLLPRSWATGQETAKITGDTTQIHQLLQRSLFFLDKRGEANVNLDSAFLLATRASQVSRSLHYKNGETEAVFLMAKALIKGHQNRKVKGMIKTADRKLQVRIMLELTKYNTAFEAQSRSLLDTMQWYADRSLAMSDSLHAADLKSMALLQLANVCYYKKDIDKGKRFFLDALKLSQRTEYLEGQGEIFSQMSTYIKLSQDPTLLPELEKCRDQIITSYNVISDPLQRDRLHRLLIMGHDQLSYHYLYKAKLSKALDYSLDMIRLMEKEGDPFFSEVPYQTIGKIYFELGKMEQSIEYHKIARSIVFAKGEIVDGSALKNITKAYISLNRPMDGLVFLEETVNRGGYDDARNKKLIAESMGNCYFAMHQFDKAEVYYLQSLESGKKLGKEQLFVSYSPLGRLYIRTGEFRKAAFYLNQLVSPGSETVPLFVKRDAHLMLYQADSAQGRLPSAIDHLKKYKSLNDSIFNESQNGKIENLRLKYETDRKDRDLLLRTQEIQLLTKKSELKESELQQARLTRNVLIAGAFILLIILSMVYSRYVFKMRTNRLLEVKQDKINESNLHLQKLNNDLQKLLGEKEWLVREIHHRVKNNLQFVVSLLNTHAAHLPDGPAQLAIRESQARMQVISMLHQKLYKVDNASVVNMKAYIPELITYIRESCKGVPYVYFDLRIESILLDISQAVPVGLILNEAIINSMKYAFPPNYKGAISIQFEELKGTMLGLTITDNGIGLPKHLNPATSNSLGLRLMKMLSDQLDGIINITHGRGVTIKIHFQRLSLSDEKQQDSALAKI